MLSENQYKELKKIEAISFTGKELIVEGSEFADLLKKNKIMIQRNFNVKANTKKNTTTFKDGNIEKYCQIINDLLNLSVKLNAKQFQEFIDQSFPASSGKMVNSFSYDRIVNSNLACAASMPTPKFKHTQIKCSTSFDYEKTRLDDLSSSPSDDDDSKEYTIPNSPLSHIPSRRISDAHSDKSASQLSSSSLNSGYRNNRKMYCCDVFAPSYLRAYNRKQASDKISHDASSESVNSEPEAATHTTQKDVSLSIQNIPVFKTSQNLSGTTTNIQNKSCVEKFEINFDALKFILNEGTQEEILNQIKDVLGIPHSTRLDRIVFQ